MITTVQVQASHGNILRINGADAVEKDGIYSAEITLTDCKNTVEAQNITPETITAIMEKSGWTRQNKEKNA